LITTRTIRKKNTLRSYQAAIEPFCRKFGERTIGQVTPDEILSFLNRLTDGNRPYTKRVRYSQLSCYFNFIRNNIEPESANPCDTPMIRKLYRQKVESRWEIIEKETIDEIIFRTTKNRLGPPGQETLVKARKGQGKFRNDVISLHQICPISVSMIQDSLGQAISNLGRSAITTKIE